jgi:uncharacterized protein YfaS (alpha-2-macroglobulin family)
MSGIPLEGQETESSNNLRMNVAFKTLTGANIDETKLKQGTDFMAEITVNNPDLRGRYKEMVLNEIFPSGWEIVNSRMDQGPDVVKQSNFTYQDIRDDRVYTYFDLSFNSNRTYVVLLNASYLGKFYLPAFSCEAMYEGTINARNKGKWIEVVEK